MKVWIPIAIIVLLVVVYGLFYFITATENRGAMSIGVLNLVGLITVIAGLLAAVLVMRRATPLR
ncbi:MAG TPA: hypothetical protein VFE91_04120 [Nitrososphaerales archaeon]|nr:hypothetical protein [Nitrososphaerales archaeon]